MESWDNGIESYDTDESLSIKKLKDLKKLYYEDNLYCWDILYFGREGDRSYMKRQYFKREWKPVNTIPAVGCLVTCIAEIVSYYFDTWKTPTHVDRDLDEMDLQAQVDWKRGYSKNSANLNTEYVVENRYHLKYNEPKDNIPKNYKDIFRNELDTRVMKNKPTIILYKEGKKMHFVVVVGIKYKGKDESGIPTHYIINDPGTRSPDARYISIDTLRSEYWGRDVTKIYLIDKMEGGPKRV